MLEDKYLQEKLHITQKQEMQTFSKINGTEVQSLKRVCVKERSNKENKKENERNEWLSTKERKPSGKLHTEHEA